MRRDVRAGLRYRQRDPAAPFDVLAKTAAKSFDAREPDLVGRFKEDLHESLALRFGDREVRVVAQ
jgi:hypothetical protein